MVSLLQALSFSLKTKQNSELRNIFRYILVVYGLIYRLHVLYFKIWKNGKNKANIQEKLNVGYIQKAKHSKCFKKHRIQQISELELTEI